MSIKPISSGMRRLAYFWVGVLVLVAMALVLPAAARAATDVPGDITGKVTDAGGAPLANIRVDAYASVADYGNGINNGVNCSNRSRRHVRPCWLAGGHVPDRL